MQGQRVAGHRGRDGIASAGRVESRARAGVPARVTRSLHFHQRDARLAVGTDANAVVDHAWRLLAANNTAIDRADAKAGAVVAVCGVSVGALVAVYSVHRFNAAVVSSGLLCAILALASTACAGLALRPRRQRGHEPESLLYFDHVARMTASSAENYTLSVHALFIDTEALAVQISRQIWSTARLATAKYDWVDRAMILLFGNLLSLALTALLLVI